MVTHDTGENNINKNKLYFGIRQVQELRERERRENVKKIASGFEGGEVFEAIKSKVESLGLTTNVLLLGVRNDINELLQAFDVLLFPSLFEGIPVSIIEAQAAGLPCILSDTIDNETAITSNVEFHSLNAPISEWINAILDKTDFGRVDTTSEIVGAGYDVIQNTKLLYRLYTQKE